MRKHIFWMECERELPFNRLQEGRESKSISPGFKEIGGALHPSHRYLQHRRKDARELLCDVALLLHTHAFTGVCRARRERGTCERAQSRYLVRTSIGKMVGRLRWVL